MTAPLWLVGATQARAAGALDRDHDALYAGGLVVERDAFGALRVRYRCERALKGASRDGPHLLLTTDRELVWVDPRDWTEVRRWSHPWLNDVHHAVRHDGRLWIASTGLDAVLEVDGDRVALHGVLGPAVPPAGDVRGARLAHRSHPNHLFVHRGRLWVTRLHQGDAITLDGQRMAVSDLPIHDGLSARGAAWFTAVDGALVRATDRGAEVHPLRPDDASGDPLGWCRGLLLDGAHAWVGFTRLRATRLRHNLAWLRGRLRGNPRATRRPTRVVRYEVRTGRPVHTVEVEPVGLHAVFAILPARIP